MRKSRLIGSIAQQHARNPLLLSLETISTIDTAAAALVLVVVFSIRSVGFSPKLLPHMPDIIFASLSQQDRGTGMRKGRVTGLVVETSIHMILFCLPSWYVRKRYI